MKTKNSIKVNFGNIIDELKSKKLKICFLMNRGVFIEDNQRHLYIMETMARGSYLDNLIKTKAVIEFERLDDITNSNIEEWEKEIWEVERIAKYYSKQCLERF